MSVRVLLASLCLWVAAVFIVLSWTPPFPYNAQRYLQILLLGSVGCLALTLPIRLHISVVVTWLLRLLAGLFVVSLLVAPNHWLAVREGLEYLSLILLIIVVAKARHQVGSAVFDRAVAIGMVWLMFGCALMVLEGLALSLSIGLIDANIVFGAFINVRFFAELEFIFVLLLPVIWQLLPTRHWRQFIGLTAALSWGLLLLSGTRSALIAIPVALVLLLLVGKGRALPWFKCLGVQLLSGLLVFLALRGLVAWYLAAPFWGEGSLTFARDSSSGRLALWQEAWQQIVQFPWWGRGPGSFACFADGLVATPHNLFFMLASEWGLLFTVVAMVCAIWLFMRMARSLKVAKNASWLHYSLLASVVVIAAATATEGMIIGPMQQMVEVLVFGWALNVFAPSCFKPLKAGVWRRTQVAYGVILLVCLALILWILSVDLPLQHFLLTLPGGGINLSYGPRFLSAGHDHCAAWYEHFLLSKFGY